MLVEQAFFHLQLELSIEPINCSDLRPDFGEQYLAIFRIAIFRTMLKITESLNGLKKLDQPGGTVNFVG